MPPHPRILLGAQSRAPVPVPRTALYAAIDAHLNPPVITGPRGRGGALALGAALSLALLPLDGATAAEITVGTSSFAIAAGPWIFHSMTPFAVPTW